MPPRERSPLCACAGLAGRSAPRETRAAARATGVLRLVAARSSPSSAASSSRVLRASCSGRAPASTTAHSSGPRTATSAPTSSCSSAAISSGSAAPGSATANASTASSLADAERPQPQRELVDVQATGQRLGEHVARQPALGVTRDAHAHELQRDDGRRLAQDQLLDVAELAVIGATPASHAWARSRAATGSSSARPPSARNGSGDRLASAGDRFAQLRALVLARLGAGGPSWRSSRRERLSTAAVPPIAVATTARISSRPRSSSTSRSRSGVDLARPAQRGVARAGELRRRAFAQRDERHLVGDLEQGHRGAPARRRRARRAGARAGSRCRGRSRRRRARPSRSTYRARGGDRRAGCRRQQQLAPRQPRRRVAQVAAVHPAHARSRPLPARCAARGPSPRAGSRRSASRHPLGRRGQHGAQDRLHLGELVGARDPAAGRAGSPGHRDRRRGRSGRGGTAPGR